MTIRWLAMTVAIFLLAGCGKKMDKNQAAPPGDNSQTPSQAAVTTDSAVHPASLAATTTEPAAPDLSALTQALHVYIFQHKMMPKTFAELVAAGYVKNIPVLPPGKKFGIDPQATQVVLVNE